MDTLGLLRAEMKKDNLSGFLIPQADTFQNEYIPEDARRLEWLTGFTGSAGAAVVLEKNAAFFTDGRYTLQAAQQVDGKRYAIYNTEEMTPAQWIAQEMQKDAAIGFDPWLYTEDQLAKFKAVCALKPVGNLIDRLWQDKPEMPVLPAYPHAKKYAGKPAAQKIADIAAALKREGAHAVLLTSPVSICWLFNIRGGDLAHTPLLMAYALVFHDGEAVLFTDARKIDGKTSAHLGDKVIVMDFRLMKDALAGLKDKKIHVDSALTPYALTVMLHQAGAEVIRKEDPCILPRACKNMVETTGARAAHVRDGVALCRFFCWLESALGNKEITEVSIAEKLLQFRQMGKYFHSASFDTIAGFGANGAIVHYRPEPGKCATLAKDNLLLLDSGGQYADGTTDVTRTIALGKPTAEQKRHFTLVLKGHIALARAVFPEGTNGGQLDALARAPLWQAGLDYDHGTGHGVGSFLNVHEGPQRIGKRGSGAVLHPGMIISNEPGYYREGHYGIRIENLVVVVPSDAGEDGRKFHALRIMTLVPMDRKLVDKSLLSVEELRWLNAYHVRVKKILSPLLDAPARTWLANATETLSVQSPFMKGLS